MVTGKAWTDEEIRLICAAYAGMLALEIKGEKYNKSAVRRETVPLLDGRSDGSYEMKCCNISAALIDQNLPHIKGYKARPAYQAALKPAALEALQAEWIV